MAVKKKMSKKTDVNMTITSTLSSKVKGGNISKKTVSKKAATTKTEKVKPEKAAKKKIEPVVAKKVLEVRKVAKPSKALSKRDADIKKEKKVGKSAKKVTPVKTSKKPEKTVIGQEKKKAVSTVQKTIIAEKITEAKVKSAVKKSVRRPSKVSENIKTKKPKTATKKPEKVTAKGKIQKTDVTEVSTKPHAKKVVRSVSRTEKTTEKLKLPKKPAEKTEKKPARKTTVKPIRKTIKPVEKIAATETEKPIIKVKSKPAEKKTVITEKKVKTVKEPVKKIVKEKAMKELPQVQFPKISKTPAIEALEKPIEKVISVEPAESILTEEHFFVELPEEYGENELLLLAVDPFVVFAAWEIIPSAIAYEEGDLVLRVYDITGIDFDGTNANSYFDIRINRRVGSGFFDINMHGRDIIIIAGVLRPDGTFKPVIRSNAVAVPPILMRDEFGIADKLAESGIPVSFYPLTSFEDIKPLSHEEASYPIWRPVGY